MKKIVLAIYIAFAAGLISCETAFLDEKMRTQVGSDQMYKTAKDFELALIGVYDMLGTRNYQTLNTNINHQSNYGGGIQLLSELGTDEMFCNAVIAAKNGKLADLDKCSPTAANEICNDVYAGTYAMLNRTNDLIYHLEQLSETSRGKLAQCEGQARFLRALCYYNLVTLWGGVPIVDKPGSFYVDDYPARNSIEEVYTRIILPDLKFAYEKLPVNYSDRTDYNSGKQLGRVTRIAAAALLARVNLTIASMARYAEIPQAVQLGGINSYDWVENPDMYYNDARTYAGAAISEGYGAEDTLLSLPYEQSFYPYENTPDVIFDVQFTSGLSQDEGSWVGTYTGVSSWHWADISMNLALNYAPTDAASQWPAVPARENCDMRKAKNVNRYGFGTNGIVWPPVANPSYALGKFRREYNPSYINSSTPVNFTVLRLAEMYLIYAEAEAELAGEPTETAYRMINYVRRRAAASEILPDFDDVSIWQPANVRPIEGIQVDNTDYLKQFRLAVLQERMFELVGEGVRRIDLIRSGWIRPILEQMNATDRKYLYLNRNFQDHNIFLPIPAREITMTNNIVVQNYGY